MSTPIDIDVARKPDRSIAEPRVLVSGVVSALSHALDLSKERPMGHAVRGCVLGMRVAQEIGLPEAARGSLYYALLMKDAGCSIGHADSETRCQQGALIARRMGLPDAVASAIRGQDRRWNGSGEQIPLLARIVSLAQTLEVFYTAGGPAAALDTAREKSGSWFDPELVRAAVSAAARGGLWVGLEDASRQVVELEPVDTLLPPSQATLDTICVAFSEVVDAKAPSADRHSAGVAGTAAFIAGILGVSEPEVMLLRRAALLHDIGKLGVSSAILEKPGKLTAEEWVALRKHAFYSYAILKRVPGFDEVSEIAGAHHERLDGSGYFRGLKAGQLSLLARILMIADVYDALSAKRPYRDALPPELAFQIMKKQAPHALDQTCLDALMRSFDPETSNGAGLAQLSITLQNN